MLTLLLTAHLAHAAPPTVAERTVRIEVTQTHPYCGGAAPSPEILEAARRPVPVAGKTYLVRQGARNTDAPPVAEIATGADGRVEARLPLGTYCLVGEDKRAASWEAEPAVVPPGDLSYDAECLAEQQRTCDLVVEVTAGDEVLVVPHALYGRCFYSPGPCYIGPPIPPPPSAAPSR